MEKSLCLPYPEDIKLQNVNKIDLQQHNRVWNHVINYVSYTYAGSGGLIDKASAS